MLTPRPARSVGVYAEILGPDGVHARSAVGVAVLPLDAPVEVELVVSVR